MKCLYCMKDISMAATVCPYCQRSTRKSIEANSKIIGGVILGGFIGWIANGFLGFIIGAAILGVIAAVWVAISTPRLDPGAKVTTQDEPATAAAKAVFCGGCGKQNDAKDACCIACGGPLRTRPATHA